MTSTTATVAELGTLRRALDETLEPWDADRWSAALRAYVDGLRLAREELSLRALTGEVASLKERLERGWTMRSREDLSDVQITEQLTRLLGRYEAVCDLLAGEAAARAWCDRVAGTVDWACAAEIRQARPVEQVALPQGRENGLQRAEGDGDDVANTSRAVLARLGPFLGVWGHDAGDRDPGGAGGGHVDAAPGAAR